MKPTTRHVALLGGGSVLIALAALVAFIGAARTIAQETQRHPARLLLGTCANPGEVAFDLTAVGAETILDGTPVPIPDVEGAASALPIEIGQTLVESSLSDLVEEPHALAVYEGAAVPDRRIACGDIGGALTRQMAGMVMPGDELVVGLAERDDSGHAGIALLRADGADALVTIYLLVDAPPGTPPP